MDYSSLAFPKPSKAKKQPKYLKTKTDYQWVKTRKQYLEGKQNHQGYYLCEECGRWVTAVEVHHKQTRGARADLKYDLKNLIALCDPCHKRTHHQFF